MKRHRIAVTALLIGWAGFGCATRGVPPLPSLPPASAPADNASGDHSTSWLEPAISVDNAGTLPTPVPQTAVDNAQVPHGSMLPPGSDNAGIPLRVVPPNTTDNHISSATEVQVPKDGEKGESPFPLAEGKEREGRTETGAKREGIVPRKGGRDDATAMGVRIPKPTSTPEAVSSSRPDAEPAGPVWARQPEELYYRVDFLGITMGYARFRYVGKVTIGGTIAYHLNVRAWTSGALAYIYPVNESVDYYLDAVTLAPVRQEFTQRQNDQDDVATYDQRTGTITYRYRRSGKIRKTVETVPAIYDPVSAAYYFRSRDLGAEDRPRNVYAGRKVWQIAARVLGNERIRTEYGEVDTIAVQPLIRRDGKPQNKGDLKVWLSGDERRVPVRLYAKFRKIREWTLVGELVPSGARAGG